MPRQQRSRAPPTQPRAARRQRAAPKNRPSARNNRVDSNGPANARVTCVSSFNFKAPTDEKGQFVDVGRIYSVQPIGSSWWASFARLYNKYRIHRARFRFDSALSSFAEGNFAMCFDSDPILNSGRSFENVSSSYKAVTGRISGSGVLTVDRNQLNRLGWYVTSPDPAVASTACSGIFYIQAGGGNTGSPGAGNRTIGKVTVELDLEVSEPSALTANAPTITFANEVKDAIPAITAQNFEGSVKLGTPDEQFQSVSVTQPGVADPTVFTLTTLPADPPEVAVDASAFDLFYEWVGPTVPALVNGFYRYVFSEPSSIQARSLQSLRNILY